jgi:hypothetical protein
MKRNVIPFLAGALCLLAVMEPGTTALGSPYFVIESQDQWQSAMSSGKVEPVTSSEWSNYMAQWADWVEPGYPSYPPHDFMPAQLYIWDGGGGGGIPLEDAGLVMTWGSATGALPPGSYSSAWKYDYLLDPDLSNSVITITVTAPQFNPQGSQINVVSFGIKDINGFIRAWYWNAGPAGPIQWGVRTIITINTSNTGVGAAVPAATSYMNNPAFDLTKAQSFVVDENALWIGAMQIPPPGQVNPLPWNYWHNLMVIPFQGIVKWAQPPTFRDPPMPPFDQCFWGWDEVSNYYGPQIVADDFLCKDDRPITDIHWWGSYLNWNNYDPPPIRPDLFHIAIWTDVPAGGQPPWSHPGTLIREWRVPIAQLLERWAGCDFHEPMPMPDACFQYDFTIPRADWFWQPGDHTIYWISISAIYLQPIQPPNPWGWKTRAHFYNDDAVRIFNPLAPEKDSVFVDGVPVEDIAGNSWDMAFVLTTNREEPMPSKPKYEQPPEPGLPEDVFLGWNQESLWNLPGSVGTIAADDWVCTSPDPVTKIRWWGSFIGWLHPYPPSTIPNHFHITFWTDVPADPTDPSSFSHPDSVIHEVICWNFTYQFVGWDYNPATGLYESCFLFEQTLDPNDYFRQPTANGIYWISIAGCYQPSPAPSQYVFGWKTRPRKAESPAPDDAVSMWEPRNPTMGSLWVSGEPLFWPDREHSWDLAFELISAPEAQSATKWFQNPDLSYNGVDVNATNLSITPPPIQFILADDFRCTRVSYLTTIGVWGSWLNDILPGGSANNVVFTLSIHADIPDPDGSGPLYSMPGPMLWTRTYNPGQFGITSQPVTAGEGWMDPPSMYVFPGDHVCYLYTFSIPVGEFQQQGTATNPIIYWLDVQARPLDPLATFGWKTTASHSIDDAVWGQGAEPYPVPWTNLRYPPGHPRAGQPLDLAFHIVDQQGQKWLRPPDLSTTGVDVNATFREEQPTQPYLLADDFPCSQTGPLTRITIFGSWLNDYLPPAGSEPTFTLSIHEDIPVGDPQNPYNYSIPGETKWLRTFAPGGYIGEILPVVVEEGWLDPPAEYTFPGDHACWRYTFDIPASEAFVQQGSPEGMKIYWLDVHAAVPDQIAKFGWKTSPLHWNDDAVWASTVEPVPVVGPWTDLHYPPGHQMYPQSIDLAFMIEGLIQQQEPYTKWSQPPEPYSPEDGFNGWNELSVYGWNQIVADDWPCVTDYPVTDLHWWGSFINWPYKVPPQPPDRFHISIWTDVPAGADLFSHPGVMFWENWCDSFNCEFVGWDWDPRVSISGEVAPPEACFRFDQVLNRDEWFFQDPGENIYWISIAAVYDSGAYPEYPWGWKTRPHVFTDDGVIITNPTAPVPGVSYGNGRPIEYPAGTSWDLAFTLTTLDCQLPGDMNMDGLINGLDIQCFVNCLIDGFRACSPNCNCACGDMNGDGFVNAADISPFVAALL